MNMANTARTGQVYIISSVLLALLLLALFAEHLWLRPTLQWPVLLVQLLPLALVLPGWWRGTARAGIWLCFVLLFYFLLFISWVTLPGYRIAHVGMTLLSVVLFSTALLFSRWQAQAERMAQDSPADNGGLL